MELFGREFAKCATDNPVEVAFCFEVGRFVVAVTLHVEVTGSHVLILFAGGIFSPSSTSLLPGAG
jgi:hypothetical protein